MTRLNQIQPPGEFSGCPLPGQSLPLRGPPLLKMLKTKRRQLELIDNGVIVPVHCGVITPRKERVYNYRSDHSACIPTAWRYRQAAQV